MIIKTKRGAEVMVDDDYYELIKDKNICLTRGYPAYSLYDKNTQKSTVVLLSRDVLGVTDSKVVVDHINGNKLDNRRENLRTCTHRENMRNIRKIRSSTGYKGVNLNRETGRFVAHITHNYKDYHIGIYGTPEEAARAYDKKALEIFGEFAATNKMLGVLK